ncbi:MAG: hypothetical protein ACRBN8_20125 [Nannocystales bacterium]
MNLDDLIAAERSAPAEATESETVEVWRSIERGFVSVVPIVGAPTATAKASTLGKLGLGKLSGVLSTTAGKVVLATTLVGGGAVGVTTLDEGDEARVTERASSTPQGRGAATSPPRPSSGPPRNVPTATAVPKQPPLQPADPAVRPQPTPPTPPAHAASRTPRADSKPTRVRPPAKPKASVQEELALIQRMQTALRSSAHEHVLNLARRHATTYPSGAFAEDREALRALAVCESGDAAGPTTASRFHKRWPESMHRDRIEAACE